MFNRPLAAAALVATTLAFLTLVPGQASAQSGSRLCGYVSIGPALKIGLLYEARTKDASYSKQCSTAISEFWDAIKKDATLSALTWEKISKKSCEHVGKLGLAYTQSSGNLKNDICDKMTAKKAYKVMKQGTQPTTFERL